MVTSFFAISDYAFKSSYVWNFYNSGLLGKKAVILVTSRYEDNTLPVNSEQ